MLREVAEDRAVSAEVLVPGAAVQVCTRMGDPVVEGAVAYPSAAGVCVGGKFYDARLYLFQPVDETHARAPMEEAKKDKKPKLGKLDPEALPDDVRDAVTVDHDMTEEQVQRVLAAVGDAALKALKGAGVREDAVYARVAAIQAAVRPILEVGEGKKETAKEGSTRVKAAAKAKGADKEEDE